MLTWKHIGLCTLALKGGNYWTVRQTHMDHQIMNNRPIWQ